MPLSHAEKAVPAWRRHQIEALDRAKEIVASDHAGALEAPHDLGVTLALVAGGYGFTITESGEVAALVAGDQGYAVTDIKLDEETMAYWRGEAKSPDTVALLEENASLREALKPFALTGEVMSAQSPTDDSPWVTAPDATPYGSQGLCFGDFRRAAALSSSLETKGDGT